MKAFDPNISNAAVYISKYTHQLFKKKIAGSQYCKKSDARTTSLLIGSSISRPIEYVPEKLVTANSSIEIAEITPKALFVTTDSALFCKTLELIAIAINKYIREANKK
jgi:hypothetical protein